MIFLNSNKEILLGFCSKISKKINLDLTSIRLISLSLVLIHPIFIIIYILLGILYHFDEDPN
jgi:phage shock protein PspC (stress-responsive transcriptional regulator)